MFNSLVEANESVFLSSLTSFLLGVTPDAPRGTSSRLSKQK